MKYEYKKIFSNPYVVILLIIALLANGYLFYRHCTDGSKGYTQLQVKAKFEQHADLEAELNALEGWSHIPFEGVLLTDDIYTEQSLISEFLHQKKETEGYSDFLQTKQMEIRARLNAGFLGEESGFPYRAQLAVAESYQHLEGINLESSFSGGISVFSDFYITDIFLLLFSLVASLILMTYERSMGMLLLVRPTAKGRSMLFVQKISAMLLFVTCGFVFLYGTDFTISQLMLGFGDISRPIQSVAGFLSCPIPISVAEYIVAFLLEKLLWLWTVSALVFCICTYAKRSFSAVLGIAFLTLVSALLVKCTELWPRCISLVVQCQTADRYQDAVMMNLFGMPVPQRVVFPGFCVVLLAMSFLGGLWLFCKTSTVPVSKQRSFRLFRPGRHCSLWRHEAFKLFFKNGGILLILLFGALQYLIYATTPMSVSQNEFYLQQYSTVLAGAPSEEKEMFLLSEEARFYEIQEQISDYKNNIYDETLAEILTNELEAKLISLPAFETAKEQYQSLEEGASYVHQTGYTRLFNKVGIRDDLRNIIFLYLFITLSLGGIFAQEHETGVSLLLSTTGASSQVKRKKLLLSAGLVTILYCIAFVPQYVAVYQTYGIDEMDALAQSIAVFSKVPSSWQIWHVFLLVTLVRILTIALGSIFVLWVSKRTANTITTMLVSLGILVFPTFIMYLLIPYLRF